MSMSTYVVGIKPPDEKWKKMKAVWDACADANVAPPNDVCKFFEDEEPDSAGVVVRLNGSVAVSAWTAEMESGFEVNISKLPKGVTIIRFCNSW